MLLPSSLPSPLGPSAPKAGAPVITLPTQAVLGSHEASLAIKSHETTVTE